jgi:hypothetical protein
MESEMPALSSRDFSPDEKWAIIAGNPFGEKK